MRDITDDNDFKDLKKYCLSEDDWTVLNNLQEILQVFTIVIYFYNILIKCF